MKNPYLDWVLDIVEPDGSLTLGFVMTGSADLELAVRMATLVELHRIRVALEELKRRAVA